MNESEGLFPSSNAATTQQQMESLLENVNTDFQLIIEYITIATRQYFNHINTMLNLINVILRNVDQYYDLSLEMEHLASPTSTSSIKETSTKRQTRVKFTILEQREKMLLLVKQLMMSSIKEMKYEIAISSEVIENKLPLPSHHLTKLPLFLPTQPQFSIQRYLHEAGLYIDELNVASLFQLHHDITDLIKKIQHRQEQLFSLTDSSGTVNLLHQETRQKRQFYVKMEIYNEKIDFLRNVQLFSMNLALKKERDNLLDSYFQRLKAEQEDICNQQNREEKTEEISPSSEQEKVFTHEKCHNDMESRSPSVTPEAMDVENITRSTIFRVSTVSTGAEILYQLKKDSSLEFVPAIVLTADHATKECRIRLTESGKEKDTFFDRLYTTQHQDQTMS
jgi:hypothetical protein